MHCSLARTLGRFPQIDCEKKTTRSAHAMCSSSSEMAMAITASSSASSSSSSFWLCDYIVRVHMSVFPMRPSVTVVTGRKGDKKLVDCSVDASPSIPSAVKAASKLSGKKKHVLHIHPHTTNYRQLTDNRFSLFKKKTGLKYKKKKLKLKGKSART